MNSSNTVSALARQTTVDSVRPRRSLAILNWRLPPYFCMMSGGRREDGAGEGGRQIEECGVKKEETHWTGKHLRGGPRSGLRIGRRRLPKRLGAVTVGYKCH